MSSVDSSISPGSIDVTGKHRSDSKLAYENEEFLTGEEGRSIRILAEYLEPLQRFTRANIHDTIVFFGSARLSSDGPMARYYDDARELARLVTEWSAALSVHARRYVVCSGGGGGIMEAANRGAADAGGQSIGLNISLPREQRPNSYVPRLLSFEFHYFFMRKLWFAHLARALIVFPGGFGTLDELTEILTLAQTRKLERPIPVILYGSSYWKEIINFDALVKHGMINRGDLDLFEYADDPNAALMQLKAKIRQELDELTPSFAHSRTGPSKP
jgi:uncharacterized protein (TIGR00730 family)